MRKVFFFCILSFVILLYTFWCSWNDTGTPKEQPMTVKTAASEEPAATVTLAAVGDIVMHLPIVNSALNTEDNSYDFRPIFAEVKNDLIQADIAVGVLETQLAGANQIYTGYPAFKTPASIGDALKWAGFKLVFTAHNHSLDRGAEGIKQTLRYLERISLPYVGCRYDPNRKRYLFVDCKGVRLAFLSYTTSTNNLHLPPEQEWMLNLFDRQKILEDIRESKMAGADCVIMALHTGIEYQRTPSARQQEIINWLVKSGVDIVLGSHVHVVQPLEKRNFFERDDGDARDCFIAYSLGNFLSNQRQRYCDYGLLLNLTLEKKSGTPGVKIVKVNYAPLWVNRYPDQGKYHYRIIKLTGTQYNNNDSFIDADALKRIGEILNETNELMTDWARKRMLEQNEVL
jgi:poly-gamma-glutamate capsule biosynthesis protein CapA/YwtB (metallophosphatase superfamily)